MNINKLFEGQRHDDKEIMYILSKNGISRMFYPDLVEVNLMKQYAEHFLVKFLDIEIEMLKIREQGETSRDVAIYIQDQISYFKDIKRQLTESK